MRSSRAADGQLEVFEAGQRPIVGHVPVVAAKRRHAADRDEVVGRDSRVGKSIRSDRLSGTEGDDE